MTEQHGDEEAFLEGVSPTVARDLRSMLELLAETIVASLGFGVAVVNMTLPDGSLEVAAVAGDESAREALLGTVDTAESWDRMLAASEPWGQLRFADHRNTAAQGDMLAWVPDLVPLEGEDAWHPEDALFAPLIASDGSRIGILSVDLPPGGRRPSPVVRRALEGFAVCTTLAIEHATLRARAEASERVARERAMRDSLTGVGSRSLFFERLEHALAARPEQRATMALAFVDLDRFKEVNDTFSHLVGDRVLTTVAQRIRSVVRPHDTVVRWGGDEFVVLLESTDDDSVGIAVVERIIAAVAEPIVHEGETLPITASVGVAFQRPHDTFDVDELVRRADEAMYSVKRSGRNGFAVHRER